MKTITKILTVAALFGLVACSQSTSVTPGTGDIYVMVFAVHTVKSVPVEQSYAVVARPRSFTTLDACNKAKAELEGSFTSDEGTAWFKNNEIDKKVVVCAPINF